MIAKDTTNVKIPSPVEGGDATGTDGFNLDGILSELGSFGKYHLLLLLLLAFRDTFLAMCNFHYIFTALDVGHRCYVPECEALDSSFNASWRWFALPEDQSTNQRMAPLTHAHNASVGVCAPEFFSRNRTLPCDKFVYEKYTSIVAEFDLGFEPWKRTLIGTVHNMGLIFSGIISGFISDRYGRKVVIVLSPLVVGSVGLAKSFSASYWMLIVFEFLETALGYGSASMILSLEAVSQRRRVMFSCIWDIMTNLGTATFGLIAWQVPYWRTMMRAIYAPLLVTVFYIFLVDEGVRWLLAHNKRDEAVRVLNKVAKYNNITLSTKAKEMLTKISEQKNSKVDKERDEKQNSAGRVLFALRSRRMVARVLLVSVQLFCCTFLNTGAIITSGTIIGSPYLNFSAVTLVAIPTRILTAFTLTRFGRKAPVFIAYLLCSFFFVASGVLHKYQLSLCSLLLYLAGMMANSYGMFTVFVMAMEAFPTTSRNSLFNLAQLMGRFGAVLAPQAPLLDQYMSGLPSVVFGAMALGPALLSLLMPDTSRAVLPDNLADAERLDEPQRQRPDNDDAEQDAPVKQVMRF